MKDFENLTLKPNEMVIAITLEEYKELLITKGKYEELKRRKTTMRDYKKEYQNRIKNKKELRCYISLDDYKSLEKRLEKLRLTPNQWLKLIADDIIHDGTLHDRVLIQILELEDKINYEFGLFDNHLKEYHYCLDILNSLLEVNENE